MAMKASGENGLYKQDEGVCFLLPEGFTRIVSPSAPQLRVPTLPPRRAQAPSFSRRTVENGEQCQLLASVPNRFS